MEPLVYPRDCPKYFVFITFHDLQTTLRVYAVIISIIETVGQEF